MEVEIENRYCQSCGMPLDINQEELLGTNGDQTKCDEYCFYCYKDGQYTVDYSMKQVVDVWVENTDLFNHHVHTKYTPHELRAVLNKRLPSLKRWKQKVDTENIYHEIINRIKVYINSHLFEMLDTAQLSQIAELSKFHFLRIFKMYTGESIGIYIQRIRLEYIAHLLLTTSFSLSNICSKLTIKPSIVYPKHLRNILGYLHPIINNDTTNGLVIKYQYFQKKDYLKLRT